MKRVLAILNGIVFVVLAFVIFTRPAAGQQAQDDNKTAKQDVKDAGHSTKEAAKQTGKDVKTGTKKAVNKSAQKTEKGAEKVEDKTAPKP